MMRKWWWKLWCLVLAMPLAVWYVKVRYAVVWYRRCDNGNHSIRYLLVVPANLSCVIAALTNLKAKSHSWCFSSHLNRTPT